MHIFPESPWISLHVGFKGRHVSADHAYTNARGWWKTMFCISFRIHKKYDCCMFFRCKNFNWVQLIKIDRRHLSLLLLRYVLRGRMYLIHDTKLAFFTFCCSSNDVLKCCISMLRLKSLPFEWNVCFVHLPYKKQKIHSIRKSISPCIQKRFY